MILCHDHDVTAVSKKLSKCITYTCHIILLMVSIQKKYISCIIVYTFIYIHNIVDVIIRYHLPFRVIFVRKKEYKSRK